MESTPQPPARIVGSGTRFLALLAGITAAALLLRLLGIGFLLPGIVETDGRVFLQQIEYLERGEEHPERDRDFLFYPLLIARACALAFDSEPAPEPTRSGPARDLEEHLESASAPHVRIRSMVAILSVLAVPATWFLARRFLSSAAALLAAAFMATSTLHLWFAQQARPHAASAAFAVIAVLAALTLRRRGRPWDYAWAGVALGLATGSLQSGFVALLPFALALFLREEPARARSPAWSLLSLGLLLGCVRFFYPFFFAGLFAGRDNGGGGASAGADPALFSLDGTVLRLSGHVIFLDQFRGQGFATLFRSLRDYEPWIGALSVLGAVLACIPLASPRARRPELRRDLVVVLAFAVPYAIAAGLYGRTYQRFAIPLLPYLCCLAAYLFERLPRVLPGRWPAPARAVLWAALLLPQAWLAWRLNQARRATDTIELSAQWVSEHIPPGERILVLPSLEVPLPQTAAALEENRRMSDNPNRPWYRYQLRLPPEERPLPAWEFVAMPLVPDELRERIGRDPAGYLRDLGGDWAVIEVFGEGRRPPMLVSIRDGLGRIADRVARFVPDAVDEGQDLPLVYQDDEFPRTSPWAWRAARAPRVGPVMEIWRIRK